VYQLIKGDRQTRQLRTCNLRTCNLVYLYEFIEHDKVVRKEFTVSNAREATRARRKAGTRILSTLAFSGKRPARANLSLRIFQVQERNEETYFLAVTRRSRERDICESKRSESVSLNLLFFDILYFLLRINVFLYFINSQIINFFRFTIV